MKYFSLFALLPALALAYTGGDGSGGGPGSFIESGFRLRATALIHKIERYPEAEALCPSTSLFQAMKHTKVRVVLKLIDPITRAQIPDQDAWTSSGEIQLLKKTWAHVVDRKRANAFLRRTYDSLVLHELYRATRGACDDEHFVLTDRVLSILRQTTPPEPMTVSVSGASNWGVENRSSENGSSPSHISRLSIYGGLAGSPCTHSGTKLCNSCDSSVTRSCPDSSGIDHAPLCACNESRVTDRTMLTIMLGSRSDTDGVWHLAFANPRQGRSDNLKNLLMDSSSVSISWGDICSTAFGSNCESLSGVQTLELILSKESVQIPVTVQILKPFPDEGVFGATQATESSEGVGQFTPFPGDGRIYLTNIATATTFPSLAEGAVVQSLIMYASSEDMDHATPDQASVTASLPVVGADFIRQYADAENGLQWFTRLGVIDPANNIFQFYPDNRNLPVACHGPLANAAKCPFGVELRQ